MTLIMLLSVAFFVFIVCLILAQTCYFQRHWKLFAVTTLVAVICGVSIFVSLYQLLIPPPEKKPVVMRQLTTPL